MYRLPWLFSALICGFAFQFVQANADEIISGAVRRTCEIWRITPENIVLIGEDSQGQVSILKKTDRLAFDLGPERPLPVTPNNPNAPKPEPQGRIARVIDKDEHSMLVRVTSYADGIFSGIDDEEKPWSKALKDLKLVSLFPVSAPSREMKIEFVKQLPDYCGEACIQMATEFLGQPVAQERVNKLAGLHGQRGVYSNELVGTLSKLGLEQTPASSTFFVRDEHLDYGLDLGRVLKALDRHRPVLLGLWADPDHKTNEDRWAFDHFVLAVGYDLKRQTLIIQDPGGRPGWNLAFEDFITHRTNKRRMLFSIEFPSSREWNVNGRHFAAEYHGRDGADVILKPDRKPETAVKYADLSKDDQEFVERAGP